VVAGSDKDSLRHKLSTFKTKQSPLARNERGLPAPKGTQRLSPHIRVHIGFAPNPTLLSTANEALPHRSLCYILLRHYGYVKNL